MLSSSLDLELQFERLPASDERWEVYDLTLFDYTGACPDTQVHSVRVQPDAPLPALEISPRQFVDEFSKPGGVGHEDGLRFGEWLESWLFPTRISELSDQPSPVRVAWDRVLNRAASAAERRPVRLQISFPADSPGLLSDLPFELLARAGEFYFRRHGWCVVRCFRGTDGQACQLSPQARIGMLWANPLGDGAPRLPPELFARHEAVVQAAAEPLRFRAEPPVRHASPQTLLDLARSHEQDPLDVLSIVAHGSPGRLWLHKDGHPQYPDDPGDPVPAADVASMLAQARVKVAFLWSCHAARGHAVLGSLARALLTSGNLAAVVGSHAALRADTTPDIARQLLQALATTAHGRLDQAVGEARRSLHAGDLQWAAPLYYARPLRGQSVLVERAAEAEPAAGQWRLENAPDLTPHFRGREQELHRGVDLVRSSRCVTLTGLPGAGKSELARAIVDRLGQDDQRPADSAVWTGLAGVTRAADLRGRLAAAFGFRDIEDDDALARALRDMRVLLILDNAEDLIAADRAGFRHLVQQILLAAPEVRFLLTSRQMLGDPTASIPERDEPVGLLPPPFDREAFLSAAGARLLPEERDSDELQQLIGLLAGHPRSLMLVAGQVGRGLSLRTIRQRLEADTVDAVTAHELIGVPVPSGSDAEWRAKRLVSSLNLAFSALTQESPDAAELFCWLGLFPSGIPTVLLESLFGPRAEERLAVLLRHSLVLVIGPDRRLVLPAPLRWYASKRLDEMTTDRRRELLARTSQAWSAWLGFQYGKQLGTTASRRAMQTAADETENLVSLAQAVFVPDAAGDAMEALAAAIAHWSWIEAFAGRSPSALVRLAAWSEAVHRGCGGTAGEANTLKALGDLQVHTDQLREAEENYRAALPIYRQIEARQGEANTLQALGDLQVRTDRLREAEENYRAALAIYRQINDRLGEANSLKALGAMQVRTSRVREAEESYLAALPIYRQIEARLGEASTLRALGDLQVRTDRLREAEESYRAALPIYRQIEERLGEANTLKALGDLQVRTDRLREAEESYWGALPIYRQIKHRLGEASTLQGLGSLALGHNQPREAFRRYTEAFETQRQIGDRLGEAGSLGYLARAARAAGEFQRSVVVGAMAWQLFAELESHYGQALALQNLARALAQSQDTPSAVAALYLAWGEWKGIEDPNADQLAGMLQQMLPNFDPEHVDPETIAQARTAVLAAASRCQAELTAAGVDPFSPLPDAEEPS
jgi:tetratricopeptide (TPR) repeat protein